MNVGELITALQALDPEAPVFVDHGYGNSAVPVQQPAKMRYVQDNLMGARGCSPCMVEFYLAEGYAIRDGIVIQ